MDNAEIAAVFYEVADILDLQGVPFKPNAYRRAARGIEDLDEDISKMASEGRLEEIPGVGESVAKKIDEVLRTGRLSYLDKLRSQVPAGLLAILRIPDVGPKTAMVLHRELGIADVEQLKEAAAQHKLRSIKGFGEKSEEKILQGIQTLESKGKRLLLGEALLVAEAYIEYLKSRVSLDHASFAGSLRRGKETVGDIDLLVGDDKPASVMEAFVSYPEVREVLMRGPTKSSVVLRSGLQVDIRAVETKSYGAALLYFTGSKDHNIALRRAGVEMGFKLNEYGLFERDSGKLVAASTEEEVYQALGLPLIPPELREDAGELEAARKGELPELVQREDIRGDLHVHTDWSDGIMPLEKVVAEGIARGYEYIAVTDHSQSLKITGGLTPERLAEQVREVRKLAKAFEDEILLLSGSEVDIKNDGTLDFPKRSMKDLDVVVGSVHSRFKMGRQEMTDRIVKAIESGSIDILGHPTGRLIGQRKPYEVDLERVFEAAKSAGVAMELNSFPDRLDLGDAHCRLARHARVKVAVGTDAHRPEQLGYIGLGVITARRGWLERRDVLNTAGSKDLQAHLGGGRR
ncbi:MAG: phosphotransferase [Euryarchaeota archaeon RBG_16_62_10]|nr:MAG: phosphotransferase [Euryarchaeota archaeon RBG_16_62_10]